MADFGWIWGTKDVVNVSDKMVDRLIGMASQMIDIVDDYKDYQSVFPEVSFKEYCEMDSRGKGYYGFLVLMLNRCKFGGESVFEGFHIIGVSAMKMVDNALSKTDVENALREFLTELGGDADINFDWEFYTPDD